MTVSAAPRTATVAALSTGSSWLARALAVSAVLHALGALVVTWRLDPDRDRAVELVDVELAPPPPKAEALPAEVAKPPEPVAKPPEHEPASTTPPEPHQEPSVPIDAGVDAPRKKHHPDASTDAPIDADIDAAAPIADAAAAEPETGSGTTTGTIAVGSGSGSGVATTVGVGSGSGVPAAIALGSGSGNPAMTDEPAVDGAPTTAGTAANLLAYFPAGHVVAALVRFDRLRGSEWAAQTERLFRPMPDYHLLFGDRDAHLADKLDLLVVSSPRPRDAAATTLVAHTTMSRPQVRDFLANPDAPITWTAAKGGMIGTRKAKLLPGDVRVVLSPWKRWFVLAQPGDLVGLTAAATGNVDAIEARAKLPPWLAQLRTIEQESGDDKRGPALVVTVAAEPTRKRYNFPDLGVGVTSLPAPERLSLAMELVTQGWLVRGNIVFASDTDAAEFVQKLEEAQQRIADSHILSALLRRQHALDAVTGLSLARTGARVSYATSLSIADARAALAAVAATLDQYFGRAP